MVAVRSSRFGLGAALFAVSLAGWFVASTPPPVQAQQYLSPRFGAQPIPSLPFTINQCGTYFLRECLTGVSGQNGIFIDADDVTIDLNGFSLIGVPGSQNAIAVSSGSSNTRIQNGTIRNWGGSGVIAIQGTNGHFQDLMLFDNGSDGLSTGANSVVIDCVAEGNALEGLDLAGNSSIRGCRAVGNGRYGIFANGGTRVVDNQCRGNGLAGAGAGIRAVGQGNFVARNVSSGDRIGVWVEAAGNFIAENRVHAAATSAYAIVAGNAFGPVVNVAGVGDITSLSGSSHPQANFQY